MIETQVIETNFHLKYDTENYASIDDVIKSLKSVEALLLRSGRFVEKAYPGVRVTNTKVFIQELQSGSLFNNFVVQFMVGGEANAKELEACLKKIAQESQPVRTVVAVGVGAAMMYGASQVLPKGDPVKAIEAHNSVIIQAGQDVNLSSEAIAEVLDSFKDKKQLAKEAIDAIYPAKAESAPIEMGGLELLTIPSSVVKSVPENYEPPLPEEKDEKYKDITLLISASDRDNADKGWAGVAAGVFDNRIKIQLDGIDPKRLHGRTKVKADVTITSRYQKGKKQYVPMLIVVTAVK